MERTKRKMQKKAGAAFDAGRRGIVEPVFGEIKQTLGFRGFSLRGFEKMKAQWGLVCPGHNLLTQYGAGYG